MWSLFFLLLDTDECDTNNPLHTCDEDYGWCENEPGSYHCQCSEGFLLDNLDGQGDCVGRLDLIQNRFLIVLNTDVYYIVDGSV